MRERAFFKVIGTDETVWRRTGGWAISSMTVTVAVTEAQSYVDKPNYGVVSPRDIQVFHTNHASSAGDLLDVYYDG